MQSEVARDLLDNTDVTDSVLAWEDSSDDNDVVVLAGRLVVVLDKVNVVVVDVKVVVVEVVVEVLVEVKFVSSDWFDMVQLL